MYHICIYFFETLLTLLHDKKRRKKKKTTKTMYTILGYLENRCAVRTSWSTLQFLRFCFYFVRVEREFGGVVQVRDLLSMHWQWKKSLNTPGICVVVVRRNGQVRVTCYALSKNPHVTTRSCLPAKTIVLFFLPGKKQKKTNCILYSPSATQHMQLMPPWRSQLHI